MLTIYVVFLYHAMLYETAFLELCWYHNIFEIGTSRKNEFGKYLDDYIAVKNILL